jgi:DNA-binding transcriptional MerR regulator
MNTKMQIGELARRTALTVDAIRFYEKSRLLPKPARTEGRFRLYSNDDIERLNFVRQMHGLGFSLREIRELTDLRTDKIEACESMRDLLNCKLAQVRRKLRELQSLESQLIIDLKKCNKELKNREGRPARACPVLQGTTK